MTATPSPLYLFSGTSTLRATTRESVGPNRGTRSEKTSVMITVRAPDQTEAERAAAAALTTPPDFGTSRDGTTYRRTYSWDVVNLCEPAPDPAALIDAYRAGWSDRHHERDHQHPDQETTP